MPLLGDTDLCELILHNLEEYSDSGEIPAYDTDFIIGFAESQLPIYYNEIVQEWSDLPGEYLDTWHDYGTEDNTTIYDLMTRDLYNYYETRTSKILDQIQEERNNGQTRQQANTPSKS